MIGNNKSLQEKQKNIRHPARQILTFLSKDYWLTNDEVAFFLNINKEHIEFWCSMLEQKKQIIILKREAPFCWLLKRIVDKPNIDWLIDETK